MAGVNGSGKTTSIAKLAQRLKDEGNSILLAACDSGDDGEAFHRHSLPGSFAYAPGEDRFLAGEVLGRILGRERHFHVALLAVRNRPFRRPVLARQVRARDVEPRRHFLRPGQSHQIQIRPAVPHVRYMRTMRSVALHREERAAHHARLVAAELNQVVDELTLGRRHLDTVEAVVMRSGRGRNHRPR